MAVTHSIIAKHLGYISCQSTLGHGTTFTFYLPATNKVVVGSDPVVAGGKGHGKIMVMDDEEMIREVTQSMLEYMGYEVVLAADGEEALRKYQQCLNDSNPVDIVIMDLTIPGGVGGKETMQAVLKIDLQAKGIVSSGYSNDPVMANYEEHGFIGFLVKPYVQADLGFAIAKALGV